MPRKVRLNSKTEELGKYAVGYNKVDFNDVAETTWYNDAVNYVAARHITEGTGEGRFKEQITLLYQIAKLTNELPEVRSDEKLSNFADSAEVSDWAEEAMNFMIGADIVNGHGENLDPSGTATRAQMAILLSNLLRMNK